MPSSQRTGTGQGTLVERVYKRVRHAIISGAYEPGLPLRLQELAADNGVSLIPVREALRLLEAERLVETTPNKGARVSLLSIDDVLDAYRTRVVLEVEALRQAMPNFTEADVAVLRKLNRDMVQLFKAGKETAFDVHRELHFAIYERSRSGWLLHLIRTLWDHTERYRRLATPLHADVDEVGEEHARVLEAIAAGDGALAGQALRAHLQHSAELLAKRSP